MVGTVSMCSEDVGATVVDAAGYCAPKNRRHTGHPATPPSAGDEYGGIEYGGLPVNYSVFAIALSRNVFRSSSFGGLPVRCDPSRRNELSLLLGTRGPFRRVMPGSPRRQLANDVLTRFESRLRRRGRANTVRREEVAVPQ